MFDNPDALARLQLTLLTESRAYLRGESASLKPNWGPAILYLLRVLLLMLVPLILAQRCITTGWWPLALPCAYLAALGLYGLFSIFHDCTHGTLVPSRRLNRALGELLGAVLLLDFDAFRSSHRQHHQLNQSAQDPKRLGLPPEHLEPDADHEDYLLFGPISGYPMILREILYAASFMLNRPKFLRLPFYLVSMSLIAPMYVLLNAGEFSILRRDWKRWATYRSALLSVLLYGFLFFGAPVLAAVLLASTLLSYIFVFMVFLTHLGPDQLYFPKLILNPNLSSLNVSDVLAGPLVRFAGGGFSEYHATHHLFPQVPIYHLERPGKWFARRFGHVRPEPLNLLARSTLLRVLDAIVSAGARTRDVGFRHFNTKSGDVIQRIGTGA